MIFLYFELVYLEGYFTWGKVFSEFGLVILNKGGRGGGGRKERKKKDKEKIFIVKYNVGVDLLLLFWILELYKEYGVKTLLLFLGVYNIGLVYKFKVNILTYLFFFRDYIYKVYIKFDSKFLRLLI